MKLMSSIVWILLAFGLSAGMCTSKNGDDSEVEEAIGDEGISDYSSDADEGSGSEEGMMDEAPMETEPDEDVGSRYNDDTEDSESSQDDDEESF